MTILRKWYYNDDNVENGEEEYEDVVNSRIFFWQLSFPQCHLLRCYQGLCNDIIEKNKDDDTDDVEIGRFLEDSNFEKGEDECEVVNAWIVLAHIVFAIFVFKQFS